MRIAEPTTTATDAILGVECLVLGARLWRQARRQRCTSVRYMAVALSATAVGALLGGISHGFRPWLETTPWQAVLWKGTLWSIGITAFFFLAAVARAALTGVARRGVMALAAAELVVYLVWTLGHDDFLWAILDYLPPMLLALLLAVGMARRGAPAAGPLIAGILLTFLGAGIQASGVALHRHFNHNDLFHIVQMVAVWLVYRGGSRMRDAP